MICEVRSGVRARLECCYCRARPSGDWLPASWITQHGVYDCPEQSAAKPPAKLVRVLEDESVVLLRFMSQPPSWVVRH